MGDKVDGSDEECHLDQSSATWRSSRQMDLHEPQVDILQDKLMDVKDGITDNSADSNAKKEVDLLWRRVRITATLLAYLKSRARVMAVPHLAHASCGITCRDGVGLVDKNGVPLSAWSTNDAAGRSLGECSEVKLPAGCGILGSSDGGDCAYMGELFSSVQMVMDVMESLVKRVIVAENEVASEKEKLNHSKDEIKKKVLQIASMSAKVEEMEKFALGTNSLLSEMKQKVEDMVLETSLQRQRAAENEQELRRVKQDFESLRSYVSGLISMRDTIVSSEQHFQSMEKLFERLFAKTTHLEAEKEQKEAEVQKLLAENAHLSAMLDKKEAQLLAMGEQCKFMALNRPDF